LIDPLRTSPTAKTPGRLVSRNSQHHEQVIGQIPVGEQHLSGAHVVLSPVSAQHLKLRRVKDRAAPGLGLRRKVPGGLRRVPGQEDVP
jgi:hypothetical protein